MNRSVFIVAARAGLVLISSLVMFGFVELGLQIARHLEAEQRLQNDPDWQGAQALHRRSEDPVLVYELIPNATGTRHGVEVTINSSGFRDHEFPGPDRTRSPRILVLGDSVTWGWGVAMDDGFPQRLERALSRDAGAEAAPPVVYNLGVEGYSTKQELRLLEQLGPQLEPDAVLLVYVLNDPDERVGVLRFPADGGLGTYFSQVPRSEVLATLARAWTRGTEWFRAGGNTPGPPEEYHHRIHEQGKARTSAYFRRLAKWSQAEGVPVRIAIVPVFDFSARGPYPWASIHRDVAHRAAKHGLESIDLYDAFRGVSSKPFALNPWHPNARGHAVIADALRPEVRELLGRGPGENSPVTP